MSDGETEAARERSTIGFPYKSLDDGIAVTKAIHGHVGHSACSFDQLAGWMTMSPKSSGFKVKVSTAKMFRLVTNAGVGQYKLTQLGIDIVDENKEKQARAEAFLSVPLFKKIYEKFLGDKIPKDEALEWTLAEVGVATKQRGRARQILLRSADQAGFLDTDRARLIAPVVNKAEGDTGNTRKEMSESRETSSQQRQNIQEQESSASIDPIIAGLIARLPASGSVWPDDERKLWLDILGSSFDLVYKKQPDSNNW